MMVNGCAQWAAAAQAVGVAMDHGGRAWLFGEATDVGDQGS